MERPLPRPLRRPLLEALVLTLFGGLLGLALHAARGSPLPLDRPFFPTASEGAAVCGASEEGGEAGLCAPEALAP